jgi:hypothetical protein
MGHWTNTFRRETPSPTATTVPATSMPSVPDARPASSG